MPDWLKDLRLLAEAEYHARRVLATLATVAADGSPRARVLIVRGILEDGSVLTTTAAGSEKIAQLELNPVAEILFWFPHERQQVRMRGKVELVREGDLRQFQWEDLSDSGRALFLWPPPGLPCEPGQQFPSSVVRETPPPESFIVLRLHPMVVETLDLNEHPHCRRRHSLIDGEWEVKEITP